MTATIASTKTALSEPAKKQKKQKSVSPGSGTKWGNFGIYALVFILCSAIIAPVLYLVFGGFRSNSQIIVDPSGMPSPWVFTNYAEVLAASGFWMRMWNSLWVALATTIGVVVLGLMAAYVLAAYKFRGREAFYTLFTAGLMFPLTVAVTPLYILIMKLGLTNNLWGVILPQIAFALPMTIIILVPFLRAIPSEIQEAAEIDGCSQMGFFFRMVLPLSMPGVVTVGILAFVNSWNSYMLPLFILSDSDKFTLPLAVADFASEYSVDTARVMAFTTLSMLPALIFFSLFEKRIVGGLTGAVKG